jgi:small subunit ribosomal protein S18
MSEENKTVEKKDAPRAPRTENNNNKKAPAKRYNKYKRFSRRKVCALCVDKTNDLDYKDAGKLRRFIAENGKILPARQTGTCAKHQRVIARTVKRARNAGVIPFVGE